MKGNIDSSSQYAPRHFSYQRILSQEVHIGNSALGGNHPIRLQSMTTTDTMDTQATVAQTLRMVAAGSEYVRITAPSQKEAHNLAEIKKELKKRGCEVPLIADIHYTPNAAEIAARIVEKVRVNPGNYADKKRFKTIEYTDASYQAEIERIHERFSPLVKICKEYGTAMRVGTNHGSLSDRIMSRYGDTPEGMVESALEFVRICEDHNFHDIVLSMKASNPQVMVQAYRLLMQRMQAAGRIYPTHLGVTEAGEGEDGRIKSALGIATLLQDGIGDTVRVSLTEEPEYELPVARFLVNHFVKQAPLAPAINEPLPDPPIPINPYAFQRRKTLATGSFGDGQVPRVVSDLSHLEIQASSLIEAGYTYIPALDKYNFSDIAADFVYLGKKVPPYELPGGLSAVFDVDTWELLKDRNRAFPYFSSPAAFVAATSQSEMLNFVALNSQQLPPLLEQNPKDFETCVWILEAEGCLPAHSWRRLLYTLEGKGWKQPVILRVDKGETANYYSDQDLAEHLRMGEEAQSQLHVSASCATLWVDGLVDGFWLEKADASLLRTAFGILQLARMRITKTEYISCPSCGRTLFDLQETTAKIRKRTEHLKGVKIGIMGCIVNGPGEMADADYGYVGVGVDKIALYRGQEVVTRAVPPAQAVDALIDLIRQDGNWVEP